MHPVVDVQPQQGPWITPPSVAQIADAHERHARDTFQPLPSHFQLVGYQDNTQVETLRGPMELYGHALVAHGGSRSRCGAHQFPVCREACVPTPYGFLHCEGAVTGRQRREAVFDPSFLEDLTYWTRTDRRLALRIFKLVEAILRDPIDGIGKPEPLRGELAGRWSRRIDIEHRLVYQVADDRVHFLGARYRY